MSDLTLGQRQQAICDAIVSGLSDVKVCEPLGQQLSQEGLGRVVIKLPAVFVACAGMQQDPLKLGDIPITLNFKKVVWTAFLVVSDLVEPTQVTDLMERLTRFIAETDFGDFTSTIERVENLYKGDLSKQPLSIYAVRFSHGW